MSETGVTLRELVAGYERFNRWEAAEQQRELASLSITDSLTQFFELWDIADSSTQ